MLTDPRVDALRSRVAILGAGGGATGPQGPTGPSSGTLVPFTFLSGSMVLGPIPPGAAITRAQLLITTPFDGVGPTVRFGTSTHLGAFLDTSDSTPSRLDQFVSLEMVVEPIIDILLLTVAAPGATQGAGFLFYELLTP